MIEKKIEEYIKSQPDELVIDEIPEDAVVYKEKPIGKKYVNHYKCVQCGRMATVRSRYIVPQHELGNCKRCMSGQMIFLKQE